MNNLYRKQLSARDEPWPMLELTFYGLQAHFFPENAEVIHGGVAVVYPSQGSSPEDGRVASER